MNVLRRLIRTLLKIVGIFAVWQILLRVLRKTVHFPIPWFMGRYLDSDLRRRIQPPGPIIARSGFQPGMRVLEVGCGSGCYTTFIAHAVGSSGEVNALDIQPEMLEQLRAKLNRPENSGINNVRLHEGSAYDLPFDDGSFDLVYLITVLQEIPDRARALQEIYRVVKPGGKLAVTEMLLDPDYVFDSMTIRQGLAAGFTLEALLGNLWTYTARFSK